MLNLNNYPIQLRKRDKIAQMVFCKLSNVNMQFLDWEEFQKGGETERKGGFGSTDA